MNSVRIIGGSWRGRRLQFKPAPGLRPSGDRIRETLFNWLQSMIVGARCLDLFAGSGSLGFEAASRGAARVVMVERHPQVVSALQANRALLKAGMVEILATDAWQYLQGPAQSFDVVFIDPPFAADLYAPICADLEAKHWLAESAFIYVETPAEMDLQLPENWQTHRHKLAGKVAYRLYRRV